MITFSSNLGGITLIRQNGRYLGWRISKIANGLYRIHNPKYPKKGWTTDSFEDAKQCAISHLSKAS